MKDCPLIGWSRTPTTEVRKVVVNDEKERHTRARQESPTTLLNNCFNKGSDLQMTVAKVWKVVANDTSDGGEDVCEPSKNLTLEWLS